MSEYFRGTRTHTYAQWLDLLNDYEWKCYWCDKPLTEVTATKDHLQPISRNGTDTLDNIVPACFACNCKKGNRNQAEFEQYLKRASAKKSTRDNLLPTLGDSGLDEKQLRREAEGGCPLGFKTWRG